MKTLEETLKSNLEAVRRYQAKNRDKVKAASKIRNQKARASGYAKKWLSDNPKKSSEYSRRYRLKNLKKLLEYSRSYAKTPAGKTSVQKWRINNPEKFREIQKHFWNSNSLHRLRCGLGGRIRVAVKRQSGVKAAKTMELIGCSVLELRTHLEARFKPGMTWENYGPVWHIDHIKPCAAFNLIHPEQQRICFHWTNLQPLFASENIQKSDKV